jgi:hypothetical protein
MHHFVLPRVPKIVTLICKNIEPIIFVASLALTLWLITQKIKAHARDQGLGVHYWAHVCVSWCAFVFVGEGHNPWHTHLIRLHM